MGGLGPMAGQANHFRRYAPEKIAYAIDRYTNEVNRLFGVMNTRLATREFLAGRYSIADMACVGWVRLAERMGQELAQFPHLKRYSRPSGHGQRSSALLQSVSRRRPPST
jgi:GST-like protein